MERTNANRVSVVGEFARLFPEVTGGTIALATPLRHRLTNGPRRLDDTTKLAYQVAVTNSVGDTFGAVLRFGHGTVWAVPGTADNLRVSHLFATRLEDVQGAGVAESLPAFVAPLAEALARVRVAGPRAAGPAIPLAVAGMRDAFISHASEDKPAVARPLFEKLTSLGRRVWFDEAELRVGDSLRERIDAGLRECRFGIVVLSPQFFSKRWPRAELDGLFALEGTQVRRILPVWHNVQQADVAAFSPILAGRLAAHTQDGLDRVVEQLVAAMTA